MDIESSDNPATKEVSASANFGKQARENPRQIIKISDLIDAAACALMAYAKSGNKIRHFAMDDKNKVYHLVRVNEQTDKRRLWLRFAPSGLFVLNFYDFADDSVGIALARKSFGL
jgi:hypothetical protein